MLIQNSKLVIIKSGKKNEIAKEFVKIQIITGLQGNKIKNKIIL